VRDLVRGHRAEEGDRVMSDIAFVSVTLLFFALAAAYIVGCERVR
jgi:hypothetical protein